MVWVSVDDGTHLDVRPRQHLAAQPGSRLGHHRRPRRVPLDLPISDRKLQAPLDDEVCSCSGGGPAPASSCQTDSQRLPLPPAGVAYATHRPVRLSFGTGPQILGEAHLAVAPLSSRATPSPSSTSASSRGRGGGFRPRPRICLRVRRSSARARLRSSSKRLSSTLYSSSDSGGMEPSSSYSLSAWSPSIKSLEGRRMCWMLT